jgi:hypothetical protein
MWEFIPSAEPFTIDFETVCQGTVGQCVSGSKGAYACTLSLNHNI